MSNNRAGLIACVLAFAYLGPTSSLSSTAELRGAWEGFIHVTPARQVLVQAQFEPGDGGWQGAIDVPGASGVPLKQVLIDKDNVRAELEIDGQAIVFDGYLRQGSLAGRVKLGSEEEYSFSLYRLPEARRPANRVEAWNHDLDHVVDRFLRYDRSFSEAAREKFNKEIANLRRSVASMSDPEVIVALSRAVALSDNAHTRLYLLRNRTALRRLPVRAYWFSDGLFIVDTSDEHRDTIGCRVVSIAGVEPRELQQQVEPLFAGNESWLEYKSPFFMMSPEILAGLGVIDDMGSVRLGLACGDDKETIRSFTPLPLEKRDRPTEPWWDLEASFRHGTTPVPLYLKSPLQHYLFEYLEPQQAVYFRYNRAGNMDGGESFKEFAGRLAEFARTHEVKRFIVDLRFNTGGNNGIAADFMRQLGKLEKDGVLGELYVLIGRATFSAGISHAAALKQHTQATFIGEAIGDELDTWSEGGNIVLPNSELTLHFTNGFHSLSSIERPELTPFLWTDLDLEDLEPDVEVPLSSADFFAGRDPVLKAALGHDQAPAAARR